MRQLDNFNVMQFNKIRKLDHFNAHVKSKERRQILNSYK